MSTAENEEIDLDKIFPAEVPRLTAAVWSPRRTRKRPLRPHPTSPTRRWRSSTLQASRWSQRAASGCGWRGRRMISRWEFRGGNPKAATPAYGSHPDGDPLEHAPQTCHLRPDHPALDEKGRPVKHACTLAAVGRHPGARPGASGPPHRRHRARMVIEGSFGGIAGALSMPDDTVVLCTFGVDGWRANVAGLRALAGLPVDVKVVDGDAGR